MTLSTITATTNDTAGEPDNTEWVFASELRGADGKIITGRPRTVKPVAGQLTVQLEPGPTMVQFGGRKWTILVPDHDEDLWVLLSVAVGVPINTSADLLAAAVETFVENNPGYPWPGVSWSESDTDAATAARKALGTLGVPTDYLTDNSGDYMVNDVVRYTDPAPTPSADLTGLYACIVDHTAGSPKDYPARWKLVSAGSWAGLSGKPIVTPTDFGAKGDASHDDTSAFQAAIDAAPVTPYGIAIVQIPDGHYVIKSTLTPKDNLVIQAAGDNCTITFIPTVTGDNLFEYIGTSITRFSIRDLRLVGEGTNNGDASAAGVAVRLSADTITEFTAERCRFTNWRYGIRLGSTGVVDSPHVQGCVFEGCASMSVTMNASRRALITDNWVNASRTGIGDQRSGTVGIWCAPLGATGEAYHSGAIISGNHVRNTYAEGINTCGHDLTVTGNVVVDCADGITVEPTIVTSPSAAEVKIGTTISGNVVTGSGNGSAIVCRHDPMNNLRGVSRVSITGNATRGYRDGIRVGLNGATTAKTSDVTVSGNVCTDHTYGLIVYDALRVALSGNMVVADTPIWIAGTSRGVSISGGSCTGLNNALNIDSNTSLVSVVGGLYTADPTSSASDAIRIAGSYVTLVGVSVDNVERSGVRVTGAAHDVSITGLLAVDDQGSPTMDDAVHVTSSGANITVDGHSISVGPVSKWVGLRSVNGVGTETANAETPTAANWKIGDLVEFTDSGDGSGNGRYVLGSNGTTWFKLAGASSGTFTDPYINLIKGSLGNTVLDFSDNSSAVNYMRAYNSAGTSPVGFSAAGAATDLSINLIPKGAGVLYAGGVQVLTASNALTVTNKRLTPRVTVTTTPGGTTLTPDSTNNDMHGYSALTKAITINAPSGTPTDYQPMGYRFKDDGTGRALTWDPIFRAIGVTLPTTTTANKTLHVFTRYNSADSKWDVIDVKQEA